MNEETVKLIAHLAEKFGTTAEHLYGVLVQQAAVSAATQVIVTASVCIALGFAIAKVRKLTTKVKVESELCGTTYTNREAPVEDEGAFFLWVGVILLGIFATVAVVCTLDACVTALFNPEYYALKHFIH